MNQKPTKPKIGQGSLQAAFRKGVKELSYITQAFPTSVSVDEPGQLWTTTQQGVSQQLGVSQTVNFSDSKTPSGFEAMNANSPTEEVEATTPEVSQEESILDSLVENAQEMVQEPEMEQEPQVGE